MEGNRQADRQLERWHPSGVQDVLGRFPGVSLRETPGYRRSTLRVEQTGKASVLGQVIQQVNVSICRRRERRAPNCGEGGARRGDLDRYAAGNSEEDGAGNVEAG